MKRRRRQRCRCRCLFRHCSSQYFTLIQLRVFPLAPSALGEIYTTLLGLKLKDSLGFFHSLRSLYCICAFFYIYFSYSRGFPDFSSSALTAGGAWQLSLFKVLWLKLLSLAFKRYLSSSARQGPGPISAIWRWHDVQKVNCRFTYSVSFLGKCREIGGRTGPSQLALFAAAS